jgi:hypothetical protein
MYATKKECEHDRTRFGKQAENDYFDRLCLTDATKISDAACLTDGAMMSTACVTTDDPRLHGY